MVNNLRVWRELVGEVRNVGNRSGLRLIGQFSV